MLATGLLVLKIIGLILLGILGIALALILLVLLAPVRYRAEASYHDEARAKAEVTWLLRIISCKAVYDGEFDVGIRILGFRVGREEERAQKAKAGAENHVQRPDEPEEAQEGRPPGKIEAEVFEKQAEERREKGRDGQERKKKRHLRPKIPFSFQGICDKLKQAGEQKDRAAAFLKNEENQKTFRLLKRQLMALLRHILPRIRGKLRFGFDDPYTTGQVLMYISPFYGTYGKQFQIIPVFEEPALEGEAWLKGRIRIGTVLAIGIRMLFDKNFRTLLRKWRK